MEKICERQKLGAVDNCVLCEQLNRSLYEKCDMRYKKSGD